MTHNRSTWHPSEQTMGLLKMRGISEAFVVERVRSYNAQFEPSFSNSVTDQRFYQFVEAEWRTNQIEAHTPKKIDIGWSPTEHTVEQLHALGISDNFISSVVPEFVMYYFELGRKYLSWEDLFMKYVRREDGRQKQQAKFGNNLW